MAIRGAIGVTALLVAVILELASPSLAQPPCDEGLEPQAPHAYRLRGDGQLCEGFYVSPVSGAPLQLVALTIGPTTIPPGSADAVVVTVVSEAAAPDGRIRIRAEPYDRRTYYRLDAEIAIEEALNWPMTQVVNQRPNLHGRIGIYGFYVEHNTTAFVPVAVAAPGQTAPDNAVPVLVIVVGRSLEDVRWRFRADAPEGEFGEWQPVANVMLAGAIRPVVLTNVPSGRSIININAREYNSAVQRHLTIHVDL